MLSVIFPVALVTVPSITRPLNDGGMVMVRLKVSGPSTMISLISDTLTAVLVVPAIKVAVIGVVM